MKLSDLFEQGGVGVVAKDAKQAKDPRYSMSMTQDIKPGETEKQVAKFGNKLDKNGHPPLLRESAIVEARGVTARNAGDQYVSLSNPQDVLTMQSVDVLQPDDQPEFNSAQEMLSALNDRIPANARIVHDNKPGSRSKAALIAQVKDSQGQDQFWVRFIDKVPGQGVHGIWTTLRGYRFKSGKSDSEAIAIKPGDIINDSTPRGINELANAIKQGVHKQVDGTADEDLARVMDEAVDLAAMGKVDVINNSAKYATVVSKYGGEYLGPLALLSGKFKGGDIPKAMDALEIKSFAGGKVQFSPSKSQELWDSLIILPDGKQVQISTKMHTGGGAASSVTGVMKQVTPEIEKAHPKGVEIMRLLGEASAEQGMIQAVMLYGIIDAAGVQALKELPKSSRNIDDIADPKLRELVREQGVAKDTLGRPDYRVYYHALTALANKVVPIVNKDNDFRSAMMKALNNNNYLQLVTKTTSSGDGISLDYYGKYPTEFSGVPLLKNKTYFATGQKGRIGFKLSTTGLADEPDDAEPISQEPTPTKRIVRPGWHKAWTGKEPAPKQSSAREKRK